MAAESTDDRPLSAGCWRRGEEPEFARVAAFTDAVYAIALTLLVLGIGIEPLRNADDPAEMITALRGQLPQFVAFGVSFLILGRFWMANHAFYGKLRAVDEAIMGTTLVYLAFVALLPFPASLVGEYEQNPVAVVVFALNLAVISGLEVVLFVRAGRRDLFREAIEPEAYRWGVRASLAPVVMFMVTMPLAFLSPTWTLVSWLFIGAATGWWFDRHAPASVASEHDGLAHLRSRSSVRHLGVPDHGEASSPSENALNDPPSRAT